MTLLHPHATHGPWCACTDCMDRRRERDRIEAREALERNLPDDCLFDEYE